MLVHSQSAESDSHGSEFYLRTPFPTKMTDGLLKWAIKNTRGHDHIKPVEDFGESWKNGLGFAALAYAYLPYFTITLPAHCSFFPDKIPINELNADTTENSIRAAQMAFDVRLGLSPHFLFSDFPLF